MGRRSRLTDVTSGFDVKHPLQIAALDASIGRIAGLQGLTGERPLPAEFRAFCRPAVRPEQAFIEAHWTVAKAESGPSLATPLGPSPKPSTKQASIEAPAEHREVRIPNNHCWLRPPRRALRFEATTLLP